MRCRTRHALSLPARAEARLFCRYSPGFPVALAVDSAAACAALLYFPERRNLSAIGSRPTAMLICQASRQLFAVECGTGIDLRCSTDPRLMAILFRRAKGNLELLLEQTEAELRAGGRPEVAAHYSSRRAPEIVQSVQRLSASRRYLYRLVRSESALVDALVELKRIQGTLSARGAGQRLAAFRKKWQFQLRRLYPGGDFSALAPALEEAVTEALISVGDGPTEGEVF